MAMHKKVKRNFERRELNWNFEFYMKRWQETKPKKKEAAVKIIFTMKVTT